MMDYKNMGNYRRYKMIRNARLALYGIVFLLVYGFVGYLEQEQPAFEADAVHELFFNIPRDVEIVRAVAKSRTQEQIETLLPEPVAKAIAERSAYPRTMAGVAHTESRGDHRAVGDGGKAKGLFQVWGSLHGPVPDDIEGQVDQANRMFLGMVAKHGYRRAVSLWNGTPTLPKVKKYQRTVLAKVQEMER